MRKKRKAKLALALFCILVFQILPVSAVESTVKILSKESYVPLWQNTNQVIPSISISRRTIYSSVLISPMKPTISTNGTLYLEKKSGNSWVSVDNWRISGIGTISVSKSYIGVSGVTYRTRIVCKTGLDYLDEVSDESTVK